MGAPTRCDSLLVARAPLQGAHLCFVWPGVFATLKPPVTERRRLQRLNHSDFINSLYEIHFNFYYFEHPTQGRLLTLRFPTTKQLFCLFSHTLHLHRLLRAMLAPSGWKDQVKYMLIHEFCVVRKISF